MCLQNHTHNAFTIHIMRHTDAHVFAKHYFLEATRMVVAHLLVRIAWQTTMTAQMNTEAKVRMIKTEVKTRRGRMPQSIGIKT